MSNNTFYCVTDEMIRNTGSSCSLLDACMIAYNQLKGSKFLKDKRSVRQRNICGEYEEIGVFYKCNGRIELPFKLIKRWKDKEIQEGREAGFRLFLKRLNICTGCRGNGGRKEYDPKFQDFVIFEPCTVCKGEGVYTESAADSDFKLCVREQIVNWESGEGYRIADMTLEQGTYSECVKCYRDIRDSYNDASQFRIESGNRIVAIQAHGEMLWFGCVPPPASLSKPLLDKLADMDNEEITQAWGI